MYLSDLMTKEQVIAEAMRHPAMKIKPRAKSLPDIDTALKATVNAIEYIAINTMADRMRPVIQDILDTQIIIDGEHDESDAPGEWEAAVDDKVEEALAEYVPILSADWLGKNTIDCRLHEERGVDKFCMSFGREIYKCLAHDTQTGKAKTPVQIMSNAGVMQPDVEAALSQHLNISKEEKETMANEQDNELVGVIEKIAAHVGKDYDILNVYNDLDLASDDDDLLAAGAAPRLGLDESDIVVLQTARLEHEDNTADMLADMLQQQFSGGKKPKADKKKEAKKEPKAKAASEDVEGAIPADVFVTLKDFGGAKDADFAAGMGVSRATYNNWVNGKNACEPTSDQYNFLRGELVERINKLLESLAVLDGSDEPQLVI